MCGQVKLVIYSWFVDFSENLFFIWCIYMITTMFLLFKATFSQYMDAIMNSSSWTGRREKDFRMTFLSDFHNDSGIVRQNAGCICTLKLDYCLLRFRLWNCIIISNIYWFVSCAKCYCIWKFWLVKWKMILSWDFLIDFVEVPLDVI